MGTEADGSRAIDWNFSDGQWRAIESIGPPWLLYEMVRMGPGDYLVASPTFPLMLKKVLPIFLRLFDRLMQLGHFVGGKNIFLFSDEGCMRLWGRIPEDPPRVLFGHAGDPESLESATIKAAWRVNKVTKPTDFTPMKAIKERAFKECLASLLGDKTRADWGGEMSDHYTAHLHLQGRRVTGAFLLKGRARFSPMSLNQLGKNNDQVYRLAQEPANVLFIQHCHEILAPVRATIRAFTVQPGQPRRYCCIDGRDSLWLLQAYGLYDRAMKLSKI